jgi:glycerate dehydrogenase
MLFACARRQLNAARLDYDGRISFDKLADAANITRHEVSDASEVVARVHRHEVVLNKEMPLPGSLIRQFPPSVKLIVEAGTGYNNIDLGASREMGIGVCNVPTYATEAMAHMAITLVMALSCSLWQQARALEAGDRAYLTQCHLGALPHFELTGKRLGLVGGLGTIGLRVAAMATALGMRVLASSRAAPLGVRDDGVEVVPFDELLATSDFVSIHCPLNAQTKGLIDAAALAQMQSSAFLVNTARGSIVDQPALVDALRTRRIAGAALDVFGEGSAPPPPLPVDSPLYDLDNVILTPHIGWQRLEARQRVVDSCADSLAAFARGEPGNIDMETGLPRPR